MAAQDNKFDTALWRYSAPPPMDAVQLAMWTELLEKRTGVSLAENRKSFLLTSLSIRMRELGYESYEEYFKYLTTQGKHGAVEWEILVDRLTVHESRFYRDEQALALVKERFLPLRETHSAAAPLRVDVWSIGCATGEEPYSLAMLIDDYLMKKGQRAYYSVTASDISTAALATGRGAIYHVNRLKNLPQALRQRYFSATDAVHFQVAPKLRERVCFTRLNLLYLDKAQVGMMDLIFCQNVLIYFKREWRATILDQMVAHLRPGGVLILGPAEISDWTHPQMESLSFPGTLAFRRIDDILDDTGERTL